MDGTETGLRLGKSFRISILESESFGQAMECNAIGITTFSSLIPVSTKPAFSILDFTGPTMFVLPI